MNWQEAIAIALSATQGNGRRVLTKQQGGALMGDLDSLKNAVEHMDLPDYVAGYANGHSNQYATTIVRNYNGLLLNISDTDDDETMSARAKSLYEHFHGDIEYLTIEAKRDNFLGVLVLETRFVGSDKSIRLKQTMNETALSGVQIL